MSRLTRKFYVARTEIGMGPFGWELLTGSFLLKRYPPVWLDIMQVIGSDGTVIHVSVPGVLPPDLRGRL